MTSKGEGWGGCRVASSRKTPKVSCVKLDSVEKMYNCANLRYSGYEQNGKFFGGQFYGGKCQLENCWGNFFVYGKCSMENLFGGIFVGRNAISHTLEPPAFKKYSIHWVFETLRLCL